MPGVLLEEARIVEDIFNDCLTGETACNIATKLNHLGVEPPSAKLWSSTMVNKMLRNPRYAGMVPYSGKHRIDASQDCDSWSQVLFDDEGHPLLGSWEPPKTDLLDGWRGGAQELGYTQSAVSQHIAALEADLGTRPLQRRPVGPTRAGERPMEHARPLLLRLDAARADIARIQQVQPARLAVACSAAACTPSPAEALAHVRASHPGLTVAIRVCGRDEVARAVLTGTVDLGLVDGAAAPNDPLPLPDAGPVTTAAVAEGPLAVVLPAGHPLAHRPALRLPDLADARWLDAPDTAVPLAQLRASTGMDGFPPHFAYDGTDITGLGALVAAGHGLAVLPHAVATDLLGTVAVRITAPRLVHRIEMLHPKQPSHPVRSPVTELGG